MSRYISDGLVQTNIGTNTTVGTVYITSTKESYLLQVEGKGYKDLSVEDSQKVIQQYIDLLVSTPEKIEQVLEESKARIDEFAQDLDTAIQNKSLKVRETHVMKGQTSEDELKIMKARLTKMMYSFLPNLPSNEWELAGQGKFLKKTRTVWKQNSYDGFYCGDLKTTDVLPEIVGVSTAWSAYKEQVVLKIQDYMRKKLAIKVSTNDQGHAQVSMKGKVVWTFIEAKEVEYKEFKHEILEF